MLLQGLASSPLRVVPGEVLAVGREQMPEEEDAAHNCFAASLTDDGRLRIEVLNACGLFVKSRGGREQAHRRGETAYLEAGDEIRVGSTEVQVERDGAKRSRVAAHAEAPRQPKHGTVKIGGDLEVPAVALGTLQLGVMYPEPRLSRDKAIELVRAAYKGGVRLFDTSDAYCRNGGEMGYAEELLAEALQGAEGAVIATKGGMQRHATVEESTGAWLRPVSSPNQIEALIRASHKRLGGRDPIPLWQVHHVDEKATVPVMKAAQRMQREGLIRHLGVCNVSVAQLEALRKEGIAIVSVQNEFSIWTRTAATASNGNLSGKTGVLDYCREHGLLFLAYAPMGGLKARRAERNLVKDFPQFAAEAAKRQCDAHALLMATMRTLWPHAVLLVGTRTAERAARLLDYEKISLTAEEARSLWPRK